MKSIRPVVASSTLLELFPLLARLPTWVPGTGYLRQLSLARQKVYQLRDMLWTDAQDAIVKSLNLNSKNVL